MVAIRSISAESIDDSRGKKTVKVTVQLQDGSVGIASVPSGASTGDREAVELRDADGKGVSQAVANVNGPLKELLVNKVNALDQKAVDAIMINADKAASQQAGRENVDNKGYYGANAILGISLAVARAAAKSEGIELYQHLANLYADTQGKPHPKKRPNKLPVGFYNLINGGAHAKPPTSLKFQELGVIPVGAHSIDEAGQWVNQVYEALGKRLGNVGIGDEGGYKPDITVEQGLETLMEAIKDCGLQGKMFLGMDCAASEFYDKNDKTYHIDKDHALTGPQMVDYLAGLAQKYPILSIEDGLGQNDPASWQQLNARIGKQVQLVGDDLTTTDPKQIRRSFANGEINATLIKLNQIGTLSETLEAIHATTEKGGKAMISHRSGETMDSTIADLAVATGSQIKPGVPAVSAKPGIAVRRAKHDRLLDIEKQLGKDAEFPGAKAFAEGPRKTIADWMEKGWNLVKGTLIILRHGESNYNAKPPRFAGWQNDAMLTTQGRREAESAGASINQYLRSNWKKVDAVYCSDLQRSEDTAGIVLRKLDRNVKSLALTAQSLGMHAAAAIGQAAENAGLPGGRQINLGIQKDWRLRERCYGAWEGQEKKTIEGNMDKEAFDHIRRGYEGQPPGRNKQGETGESLKMVQLNRTDSFYTNELQKRLDRGENVIVAAHGNSLRALMLSMGIKTPETIKSFELGTAKPMVVEWDPKAGKDGQYQLHEMAQQQVRGH